MHVDVYVAGVHVEEEREERVAPVREQRAEGPRGGVLQAPTFHHAPVDEHVLVAAGAPRHLGRADDAADGEVARRLPDGHERAAVALAEEVGHALRQRPLAARGGEPVDLRPVVDEAEGHVRVREGEGLERLDDVLELRRRGAEEGAPGRHVVEEVPHGEGGAAGGGARRHLHLVAAVDADARARVVLRPPRLELHARDGSDGGEGLAAEAERAERFEVLEAAELARGVAAEGASGVGGAHAAAVVGDLDKLGAGTLDGELHAPRPGVQGVLHHLLDGVGGPLHHLARGDLAREGVRQGADEAVAGGLAVRGGVDAGHARGLWRRGLGRGGGVGHGRGQPPTSAETAAAARPKMVSALM